MIYSIIALFLLPQVALAGVCPDGKVCGIMGWFFTVSCEEQENEEVEFLFSDTERVWCIIKVEEELLANVSIEPWDERAYFVEAFPFPPNMKGKNVSITWRGGEKIIQKKRIIEAMNVSSCGYVQGREEDENIKEAIRIPCSLPKCMKGVPKVLLNGINVTWYRDDEPMKMDGNYSRETILGKFVLKIRSATFNNAPGTYRCEIERNGSVITGERTRLCLFNKGKNIPYISAQRKVIEVEPGGTAILRCYGNTGTGKHSDTLSQGVEWKRNDVSLCLCKPKVCENYNGNRHTCSWTLMKGSKICRASEYQGIFDRKRSEDRFNSTFILRNLSVEDSGSYICKVFGTGLHHHDTIEIVVSHSSNTHNILFIAVGVITGVIILGLITAITWRVYRVELQYAQKRIFVSYKSVDRKPFVAYLLYSSDAYTSSNANPIEDVTTWLDKKSYPWYDRQRCENGEANDTGALLPNHVKDILEQCTCLIVFVTEGLINENTWEIFEAYEGINKNIMEGFRIVFICSRGVRNMIHERSRDHKTYATFEKFMNMRHNYVIEWKESNQAYLDRCLYIAVPKLQ